MSCVDCGQDTLSDGICISCTDNRIEGYPRLKRMEERLDKEIDESKSWLKPVEYEKVIEILQKIKDGKNVV